MFPLVLPLCRGTAASANPPPPSQKELIHKLCFFYRSKLSLVQAYGESRQILKNYTFIGENKMKGGSG